MLLQSSTPDNIYNFLKSMYPELKFWGAIGGFFFAVQKGLTWLKTIKTNDLHHIQQSIDLANVGMKEQTASIVGEFKELRKELHDDFRALTMALITPRN